MRAGVLKGVRFRQVKMRASGLASKSRVRCRHPRCPAGANGEREGGGERASKSRWQVAEGCHSSAAAFTATQRSGRCPLRELRKFARANTSIPVVVPLGELGIVYMLFLSTPVSNHVNIVYPSLLMDGAELDVVLVFR